MEVHMFWNEIKKVDTSVPFYNQHKPKYYNLHISL